jgi:hypothetical protein
MATKDQMYRIMLRDLREIAEDLENLSMGVSACQQECPTCECAAECCGQYLPFFVDDLWNLIYDAEAAN